MRKHLSYLLILGVLLTCLAGCATKQPSTPTNITPSQSNPAQVEEASLIQKPTANETNDEQPKQTNPSQSIENNQIQKSSTVQSVVQQPQKELNKEVTGSPAGPLAFRTGDVLGNFKKWIETVPLMPDDVQAGSEAYYYYLNPEFQEMLVNDRYYLLPIASEGYALKSIWITTGITFYFENNEGNLIQFSYATWREQLPKELSAENQKLVQFGGVQYLQEKNTYKGSTNLKLTRKYDKYTISVSCDNANKTGITPEQAANLFTFTKVDLPPLKAVMQ